MFDSDLTERPGKDWTPWKEGTGVEAMTSPSACQLHAAAHEVPK